MIEDGLAAKEQIANFVQFQTEFSSFTQEDWSRLEQINRVLSKFNIFTLEEHTANKYDPANIL